MRRNTKAWQAQAWISFIVAAMLCAIGLAWLPGREIDDHPNEKRFIDRIETVTVDSVFSWLERDGLGGKAEVIR